MTAVSRKRGTLRQIIAHEGANWAGNKFKEFQTNRTIQILSQKADQLPYLQIEVRHKQF